MTEFTEGQQVTLPLTYDLPIGSILTAGGETYVREQDGFHVNSAIYAPHMMTSTYTIRTVGSRVEEPDTLDRFKQRLRTITLGQSVRHSIDRGPVVAALHELDCPAPIVPMPGMWMHLADEEVGRLLPNGAVAVSGDLSQWATSGLFIKQSDQWVSTLGGRAGAEIALKVVRYPEGTVMGEWPAPDENEQDRINEFIAEVWRIGSAARAVTGWCPQYDVAIGRAGVDRIIMLTRGLGAVGEGGYIPSVSTSIELLDAAPPGTWVLSGINHWVKCADGMWRSFTEAQVEHGFIPLVGGTRALSIWTSTTLFTWMPFVVGGDVANVSELDRARTGTEIDHGGNRWTKQANGLWAESGGTVVAAVGFQSGGQIDHTTWATLPEPEFGGVVGERVANMLQLFAAPVGSAITHSNSTYVKREGQRWYRAGSPYDPWQFGPNYGLYVWSAVGAAEPAATVAVHVGPDWRSGSTRPPAGTRATVDSMNDAPLGTRVATGGMQWRKEPEGWRSNTSNALESTGHVMTHDPVWLRSAAMGARVGRDVTAPNNIATAPNGSIVTDRGQQFWMRTGWELWEPCDVNGNLLGQPGITPAQAAAHSTRWHRVVGL